MLKSISLTIIATFIGQAFGFFADIFIASSFGTSWRADAYFLAMVIPIILADLFMMCINAVFIPAYMTYRNEGGEADFFNTVTSISLIITIGISAVAFFLSPYIIEFIAGKFTPEAMDLTITLTRMLLVLAVTMPLATILSSRLNAHDQFAIPALGKSFNFGFIILSLLALKETLGIFSLPLGFIAGNVVFILSLIFLFYRSGLGFSPRLDSSHPALKELSILLLPLVVAGMANYVNIFIERSVAAFFQEGSIAALNYSFKLVNIPVNLFILGGMSVILPAFSKHAADKDITSLGEVTLKSLRFISFFIVPAITFIAFLRVPIVRLLFERGEFSAYSSETTSTAVFYYAFGLLGLSATTLMTRVFFAIKDTRILSFIGVAMIVFNIVLILILSSAFGFIGIPITFSVTATVHMLVMIVFLHRRLNMSLATPLIKDTLRNAASALIMGFLIILCSGLAARSLDLSIKLNLFVYLAGSFLLASMVYLAASIVLGSGEAKVLLGTAGYLVRKGR